MRDRRASTLDPRAPGRRIAYVALAATLALISCTGSESDYSIRAGVLEVRDDGGQPHLVLARETTKVERAPHDSVSIGFAISSSKQEPFEVRTPHGVSTTELM